MGAPPDSPIGSVGSAAPPSRSRRAYNLPRTAGSISGRGSANLARTSRTAVLLPANLQPRYNSQSFRRFRWLSSGSEMWPSPKSLSNSKQYFVSAHGPRWHRGFLTPTKSPSEVGLGINYQKNLSLYRKKLLIFEKTCKFFLELYPAHQNEAHSILFHSSERIS